MATGLKRGRGLGLTRPVIRVQQKPASLHSIAPAMGRYSLWSPWDFITQRQMDEPGTAQNFGNREGRLGVVGAGN